MKLYTALKGLTADSIKKISEFNQEPKWLLQKRLIARQLGAKKDPPLDIPDISTININKLRVPLSPSNVIKTSFTPKSFRRRILITNIYEAAAKHKDLFLQYFDKLGTLDQWSLADYTTAVFTNGIFLRVQPYVNIKPRLHLHCLINSPRINQFKRNIFIVEEGSSARIAEDGEATYWPDKNMNFETTEIFLKKNASLDFDIRQNWQKNVYSFYSVMAKVAENGRLFIKLSGTKASISLLNLHIELSGNSSSCIIQNDAATCEKQIIYKKIGVNHIGVQSSSEIVSRGMAKDKSWQKTECVCNVLPEASHAKSNLSFQTLIRAEAQASSLPILNVQNSTSRVGVSCQYAAFDRNQEFYLQTRGFDDKMIETLLVKNIK